MLCGSIAEGQGTVSGHVVLAERRGAARNDVRNAVVYLEPLGRFARPVSSGSHLASAPIAMRGREFIPHVRAVLAGGSVVFPNQDPFSHNVFSNAVPGTFDLGLYRRGNSRSASFSVPGVYPVYCNIHSKMVSFVVAVQTPWFAHPSADGGFAIVDVPAGTYLLHAWHERAAAVVRQEIVVSGTGASGVRVSLDARAYVSAPHFNKFGLSYSATRNDRY